MIAIKVNPTRGKEIIKILSDLGGKHSSYNGNGTIKNYCYFIDKKNNNKIEYDIPPTNYKIYTLEEFEKEFPFKVGDKVIKKNTEKIGTIIKRYSPYLQGEMLPYDILYMVQFNDDPIPHRYSVEELKPYKEMKEERNVTLTLDKAKEWYKKGGDLKQVALQAFTEEELTKVNLPKTWEEFCEDYPVKKGECWLEDCDTIRCTEHSNQGRCFRNWIPSKKSAEAHLAIIQLEQLRDCWRQGWKPIGYDNGYCIIHYPKKYVIMSFGFISFLSFPTRKMAEEFLNCFRDLIEQAGDLI